MPEGRGWSWCTLWKDRLRKDREYPTVGCLGDHVFHALGLQVADQGHVLVALGEGLLVDAEMDRHPPHLAPLAPANGAGQDARTAIPTEPGEAAHRLQAALLGQVDDAGLQGPGQTRAGLGPLGSHGEHAVDPALDAGQVGMDVGRQVEGVQMAPLPLGGMVVDGTPGVTARQRILTPRSWST